MKWYYSFLFIVFYHPAYNQGISSILDKTTNPGEALVEFDNRSYSIEGSYYIFEDWQMGNINLKSGINIPDQWINYNSENDMLEVKLDNQVKVVPLLKIDQFILKGQDSGERLFLPCSKYLLENDVPLVGLCEVLDTNYFGLIYRYSSDIKEATYVPELDMGKKEDEIVIKKKAYLTFDYHAYIIPKKKQNFISLYQPHHIELELFMKEKKLNHRIEEELQIILDFLNDRFNQ
jgi:hypothetical protein